MSGYAINICIFSRLRFGRHTILLNDLVPYMHAKFQYTITYGRRHITVPIWWLLCNSYWIKWPKMFCAVCVYVCDVCVWFISQNLKNNINLHTYPDSKVHVAHIGPTWALSAPGRPHVGPMNLVIRVELNSPNKSPVAVITATVFNSL